MARRNLKPEDRTLDDLTPKELAYCHHYTALGADTCGHQEKAAVAAGYPKRSARNAGWRLMKRPVVRAYIQKIHREAMDKHSISPEGVLFKTESLRLKAEDRGDLVTAARCVEMQGRFLGMFDIRVQLELDNTPKLEGEKRAQAQRIAAAINQMRVMSPSEPAQLPPCLPPDSETIEARFEDTQEEEPQTQDAGEGWQED